MYSSCGSWTFWEHGFQEDWTERGSWRSIYPLNRFRRLRRAEQISPPFGLIGPLAAAASSFIDGLTSSLESQLFVSGLVEIHSWNLGEQTWTINNLSSYLVLNLLYI